MNTAANSPSESGSDDDRISHLDTPDGLRARIRELEAQLDLHQRGQTRHLRARHMENLGELTIGIAHDLNNALAPVLMSIDLLRLRVDNASCERLLQAVETSARRGADLVKQVLVYARGLEGAPVPLHAAQLIKDVALVASETFPAGIATTASIDPQLWPVMADPTQLHQVLLNLAINARDAMPAGGSLTFTARNLPPLPAADAAGASGMPCGPVIEITVRDTGTGIAPEVRERLFDPFFTTKPGGRGLGMGLATARTIVNAHGGVITFESEPGQGATFTIRLPADPALRPPARCESPSRFPSGRGQLLLVIEDEPSLRDVMQQTLESFGYQVITAEDGRAGIELFEKRHKEIAATLVDLLMPRVDGMTTIRELRRIVPGAVVLAMSGLGSQETAAREAGARAFLAKPCGIDVLLQTLARLLV
ncbi:response regulator [Opitutaceae bacterium TAV4]|uniref:hybrid sensor histidine kinase/response regulator n=1 Tax=Geminisphaera colitermitum TaxID=1148786 RepID=UPI000158CF85|nr:ATP-binding protein [Geminisphaera colitermitum]RRJ94576.1 response regulator [Opitutaceae bacterium TAV4]RRJ98639.1 response regulator [Opitutaceae bacterium TAV3]